MPIFTDMQQIQVYLQRGSSSQTDQSGRATKGKQPDQRPARIQAGSHFDSLDTSPRLNSRGRSAVDQVAWLPSGRSSTCYLQQKAFIVHHKTSLGDVLGGGETFLHI